MLQKDDVVTHVSSSTPAPESDIVNNRSERKKARDTPDSSFKGGGVTTQNSCLNVADKEAKADKAPNSAEGVMFSNPKSEIVKNQKRWKKKENKTKGIDKASDSRVTVDATGNNELSCWEDGNKIIDKDGKEDVTEVLRTENHLDDKAPVGEEDDDELKQAKVISLMPFHTIENTNSLNVKDLDFKEMAGVAETNNLDSVADSDPQINHLFGVLGMCGIDVERLEMGEKDWKLVLSDIDEQSKALSLADVPAPCTELELFWAKNAFEFEMLIQEILLMAAMQILIIRNKVYRNKILT